MFLQVIRFRSLEEERKAPKNSLIDSELQNSSGGMVFYIILRASERFYTTHNRFPGSSDDVIDQDLSVLRGLVNELLKEMGISNSIVDEKYLKEMVRFGASELHPIASLLGGLAAQETIKILTHQFTPLDNTFIFNGMDSTSSYYSL